MLWRPGDWKAEWSPRGASLACLLTHVPTGDAYRWISDVNRNSWEAKAPWQLLDAGLRGRRDVTILCSAARRPVGGGRVDLDMFLETEYRGGGGEALRIEVHARRRDGTAIAARLTASPVARGRGTM